jgi:hypothetical protein
MSRKDLHYEGGGGGHTVRHALYLLFSASDNNIKKMFPSFRQRIPQPQCPFSFPDSVIELVSGKAQGHSDNRINPNYICWETGVGC